MRLLVIGRERSGTTITRKILSSHPDIWITNELLLYDFFCGYGKFKSFNKWVRKRFPKNYRQYRYAFPFEIDASMFKKEFKRNLGNGNSVADQIRAAEESIFKGQFKIFGDKCGHGSAKVLNEIGLPFKALYIYRDGRDSVASSIIRNKGRRDDMSWKTADPTKSSLYWANTLNEWFQIKQLLNQDDYLEVKFERYIESPEETYQAIANFLQVDNLFDKNVFDADNANIGRYKQDLANWETIFSPEAIKVLEKLEYI